MGNFRQGAAFVRVRHALGETLYGKPPIEAYDFSILYQIFGNL